MNPRANQLKNVALVVVYASDEGKCRFKAFWGAGNELLLPNRLESNFFNQSIGGSHGEKSKRTPWPDQLRRSDGWIEHQR